MNYICESIDVKNKTELPNEQLVKINVINYFRGDISNRPINGPKTSFKIQLEEHFFTKRKSRITDITLQCDKSV